MKYIFVLLIALSSTATMQAQQRQYAHNNDAWLMYIGDHKISQHWGVHLEAQMRRHDWGENWQQLLLRGGINYHFLPQAFASVGYCFVETYPYGEYAAKIAFPENRTWQQVQTKSNLGIVESVSRFRMEQRWVQSPQKQLDGNYKVADTATYSNRFRFLQRYSVPLKGKEIKDKSFYISAYDEFFINFGKNVKYNIFDQNRAYLALGYKVPKVGRLELGYLNQLVFKGDGVKVENNNTLQVGLLANMNFGKI